MYPWGVLLQALAIVHFLRRRPETIWMYVILFLGPPGALIYILIEVVPDLGLLRHVYDAFGRRKRISHLEAVVRQETDDAAISAAARASLVQKGQCAVEASQGARLSCHRRAR